MAEMSPLRRRMIEDMTIRNLSPATHIPPPCSLEVQPVFRSLARSARLRERAGLPGPHGVEGVACGSLNQVVRALRFFYGVTLGHATIPERIVYARKPRKLPMVLGADEGHAFWNPSQA